MSDADQPMLAQMSDDPMSDNDEDIARLMRLAYEDEDLEALQVIAFS